MADQTKSWFWIVQTMCWIAQAFCFGLAAFSTTSSFYGIALAYLAGAVVFNGVTLLYWPIILERVNRTLIVCSPMIWLLLVIAGTVVYLTHLENPPSYISFTFHRSQTYYSNFSDACDQLLTKGTNEIHMSGEDPKLPKILRKMRATSVSVTSSRVWVVVDINAGYGVTWSRDDFQSNVWKLTVISEAEPQNVYAVTNKTRL